MAPGQYLGWPVVSHLRMWCRGNTRILEVWGLSFYLWAEWLWAHHFTSETFCHCRMGPESLLSLIHRCLCGIVYFEDCKALQVLCIDSPSLWFCPWFSGEVQSSLQASPVVGGNGPNLCSRVGCETRLCQSEHEFPVVTVIGSGMGLYPNHRQSIFILGLLLVVTERNDSLFSQLNNSLGECELRAPRDHQLRRNYLIIK